MRKWGLVLLVMGLVFVGGLVWARNRAGVEKGSDKAVSVEGFPAYPGATQESFAMVDDKGNYKAEWKTGAMVPEVTAWYRDNLPKEGWMIDLVPADWEDPGVQLLEASRGEKTVSVSAMKEVDGRSLIVIEQREKYVPEDEEEEE